MRISDTERERVVDELRRHLSAGRLDLHEYGERLEEALAASTLEEADRALRDLPMVRIADPHGSLDHAVVQTRPMLAIVISALVVGAAVIFAVLADWALTAVLVIGWLVGLGQGRMIPRRRSSS